MPRARWTGDDEVHVAGDRRASVDGRSSNVVTGDADTTVRGSNSVRVDGDFLHNTRGGQVAEIGEGRLVVVRGDETLSVSGSRNLSVGSTSEPSTSSVFVHGSHTVGTSESLALIADQNVSLASGDSRITLTPEGITMTAPSIRIRADELVLVGDGPSLTLTSEAELLGSRIALLAESATSSSRTTPTSAAQRCG